MQDLKFDADLEYISPKAVENNGANQFEVKAAVRSVKGGKIRSGYSANAEIVLAKASHVITVPESAIEFSGDSTFVYIVKGSGEKTDSDDVTKNVLLRSHTSNDEAHYMETHEPPIRVLCPGRVYRNEAISARAHCFFHQVEGLYVDKNVSFTDLKQVLLTFAREMFGADTKIRLRPSYFPFTEPSAEMDISCNICGGKGCNFCKHTGWVEILGCGMVDPHDLEACGIDSNVYTGYAFGMGVERITNLKYRVSDLRLFSENDTRFLREFESAK